MSINAIIFWMIALITLTHVSAQTNITNETRDRYLLLDHRIINKTVNAELTLGRIEKHESNPLFREDKLWELRFDNLYANVIYDEEDKIYKCWYSPFIVDPAYSNIPENQRANIKYPAKDREMGVCYATSDDGIHWDKPKLGLVEFEGNKNNNIVWRGPHGFGVFKDLNDPDPKRRYKAIFKKNMISVAFSPDGLHWAEALECPEANVAGDTHNNALWAPTLGEYVAITRMWNRVNHTRQVGRTSSKDFIQWRKTQVVLEGIDNNLQTYAMPVFFHGSIYIGLVAIHDQKTDHVWTELTWSPDTKIWYRVSPGTPLIANSEQKGSYDWGCIYAAAYPVFLENEIRLYYGGSDGLHFGWRKGFFCLATLRPDGFAGYEQISNDSPAVILTNPVKSSGQILCISADIWENGFIKITRINENGEELSVSKIIKKTVTDHTVKWMRADKSLISKGDSVRLQFELHNAKLYSFCFSN